MEQVARVNTNLPGGHSMVDRPGQPRPNDWRSRSVGGLPAIRGDRRTTPVAGIGTANGEAPPCSVGAGFRLMMTLSR